MPATPKKGRRFGGSSQHQKLMMANLVSSLVAAEAIETTEAVLLTALTDADPMLREAVAKALKPHTGRPNVKAAVVARQRVETAPLVKEALWDALKPAEP